jgi:hypothetical protein
MKLVSKSHCFINSSNRIAGSLSDFNVSIDTTNLPVPEDSSYTHKLYISSFICQNDFEVVSQYTDNLHVNNTPVQLKHGKPSPYELVADLNTHLPSGANAAYNQANNKLIFSTILPFTLDFSVPNSAYELLGFNREVYTITDGFISPGQVNVDTNFDLIYIRASFAKNMTVSGATSVPTQTLCQIPIITPAYSKICDEDDGVYSTYVPSLRILQDLRLSVVDYSGINMPLNSQVFIVLTLETWHDDTSEMIKELQGLKEQLGHLKELSKLSLIGQSLERDYAPIQKII